MNPSGFYQTLLFAKTRCPSILKHQRQCTFHTFTKRLKQKMRSFTLLIILALSWFSAAFRLPCDSVLHRLPSFSFLFTHCDCLRTDWTDWSAINRTAVPASQCPSLSALTYKRRQQRISGDCQDIVENRTICK